jgi:hypothetical protein
MPDQSFTGHQASFEEITAGLRDVVVPPVVLARWAAVAGQLASRGHVPTQPTAA